MFERPQIDETVSAKAGARFARLRARLPALWLYAVSTGSLMLGAAAQLASFVVLARHLGIVQFGLLMTITAVTNVGLQLCGVGAGEGLVRRVARERGLYPLLLGHNLLLTFGSGVLLCVLITLGLDLVVGAAPNSSDNLLAMAVFAVSNVLLFRLILLAEQIYIAHGRIGAANVVNAGFSLARAAVALIACVAFGVDTLSGWAYWHGGLHLAAALLCAIAVARFGRPRWRLAREELRLGVHFVTPWLFWSLRQNIDLIVLGLVASPATVGAYGVVKRMLETSLIPISSINRLVYPRLSAAGADGAAATLRMTCSLLPAMLAVAVATGLALYLAAPLLPWLFGASFGEATGTLQLLAWVVIVIALQKAAFEALGAAEHHGIRATVYNLGSLAGTALTAGLAYAFLVPGTVAAIYTADAAITLGLWLVLIAQARRQAAPIEAPPLPATAR